MRYHDNEYAMILLSWVLQNTENKYLSLMIQIFECILRILFSSTGHNAQHRCILSQRRVWIKDNRRIAAAALFLIFIFDTVFFTAPKT